MKMDQSTTQTSTALLRNATGVDTTETNSLCCAAAGIIAPLSATAEALIPHEKLRGAALTDATLNAQDRPPAQPVVGYTPPLHTQQDKDQIAKLMCITGVGRKMARRIHAAGVRWIDAAQACKELKANTKPVCHIALKDLEYLQGGSDRHAVVRASGVSKYKQPLYSHADAGQELAAVLHWRSKHAQAIKERDTLQQRLTESNALLVETIQRGSTVRHTGLRNRIRTALSASAEPSIREVSA